MTELEIGGGRISEAAQSLPDTMTEEERKASEREAERQELSKRLFFSGDPATALLSLIERVRVLEDRLGIDPDADSSEHPADKVLEQLESVKAAIDSHPRHEEPPAAIADLFHPDKPMAPQAKALRDKWLEIGHQIHRGEASADEIRKHERLSSEIQFLNSHAFDGV